MALTWQILLICLMLYHNVIVTGCVCKNLNFLNIYFIDTINYEGSFQCFQSKWSSFDSKLRHIETELSQHHAIVGEIKSVVDQIVEQSQDTHQRVGYQRERDPKAVGDEPPRMSFVKWNDSSCAMQKKTVPKTDIQVILQCF